MSKRLTTADEIVTALGGRDAVAELTGAKPTAIMNWQAFNAFPPRTYLIMIKRLVRKGYSAPPALWKMVGFEDKQTIAEGRQ